jgi:hypothetical protein
MSCPRLIKNIRNTQNVGDSLLTINNNFYSLGTILCQLKRRVENLVDIRTFFYYGPNAGVDPVSGMEDEKTSRPSNQTIESFVNGRSELNLIPGSRQNDQVYVVYQKTGYRRNSANLVRSGSGSVSVIGAGTQTYSWRMVFDDRYNTFSPVFIIWKLTFNGTRYTVQPKFPKYTQAETFSTGLWKSPELWTGQF